MIIVLMACSARAQQLPVIKPVEDSIGLNADCDVVLDGGSVTVTSRSAEANLRFDRPLDLSGYGKVNFTVTNNDDRYGLNFLFIMEDWTAHGVGFVWNANLGRIVRGVDVGPGETCRVEIQLPEPLSDTAVDDRLMESNMRGTPFSQASGCVGYRCDYSKVEGLLFNVRRIEEGVSWTISDFEITPGEKKCYPGWADLSEDEFFPFIDRYGQFKYSEFPGKVHSDKDLRWARLKEWFDLAFHRGPHGWDRFGGWKNGPQLEATGRFRVEKIDGKWWFVDPEGHLFWSHGVVRVTPSCGIAALSRNGKDFKSFFEGLPEDSEDPFQAFYYTHDELMKPYYAARNVFETYDFSSSNAYRKYGPHYREIFARLAHRRLRSWGMNTMANSSDRGICSMKKTPYNVRIDLGAPVEGHPQWPVLQGSSGWWKFIDPFDELFPECVRAHLMAEKEMIESPWCLGFFVDNEIKWGEHDHFARLALKASSGQAAKAAFCEDLKIKYGSIQSLNKAWHTSFSAWGDILENREDIPGALQEDLCAFTDKLVDRYFSIIREEVDRVVPGSLYMGCRYNRTAPDFVATVSAKYCDVLSYNIYNYNLAWFSLPAGVDKPVIIGEFHFGATDRGPFHTGQVHTDSQDDRAESYGEYVHSALANEFIVGTNWHQFSDQAITGRFDGENFQVGLTDVCDNPYEETVARLRSIGRRMYEERYAL